MLKCFMNKKLNNIKFLTHSKCSKTKRNTGFSTMVHTFLLNPRIIIVFGQTKD